MNDNSHLTDERIYFLYGLIRQTDETIGYYTYVESQPNELLAQQRAKQLTTQDPITYISPYQDIIIKESKVCLGIDPPPSNLYGFVLVPDPNDCLI